jgi:hypothetical protein
MNKMLRSRLLPSAFVLVAFCAALGARTPAAAPPAAARPAAATPLPSPEDLLVDIRAQFRSHRPPPPYEVYTLVRKQATNYGYPDYVNSYTDQVWYRSSDHAALERQISNLGDIGPMQFQRPLFNQDRDPGPPTADIFEPAPLHTLAPDFVPTPEASLPPTIAVVRARGEFDYRVTNVQREGDEIHVSLTPRRQPDRNRLRELWVDGQTLDIRRVVATDKLFIENGPVYPVLFTIDFSMLQGIPIVTHIHGVVYGGYDGDGQTVDYDFKNTYFPQTLPDWYFNPRDYAQHLSEAPEPPESGN